MSAKAVADFLAQIPTDAGLAKEVRTVIAERQEESAFELVELGGSHGFDFTATELRTHLSGMSAGEGELNEAELESVTGGLLSPSSLTSLRVLTLRDNPIGGFTSPTKRKTIRP